MGLDTTHNCFHGPYTYFGDFRRALAKAAGMPPLALMEGFYRPPTPPQESADGLPIKWEALKPDPIHVLINHSDCDGSIDVMDCLPLANRLRELLPLVGDWQEETTRFIKGLLLAFDRGEDVEFH